MTVAAHLPLWEIRPVRGEALEGYRSIPLRRVSANLVAARKRAGLTQGQLAERCGLHRTEISLLERQGREPRLGTLVKLADSLEVPVESLCAGVAWDVDLQRFNSVPRSSRYRQG
jgi:transcriptional regulator with XRE-family HTH domain